MKDIKWIKWEDLGKLKNLIKYHIDTGSHRSIVCDEIEEEHPGEWKRQEIHKAISELKRAKLLAHYGHGYYKVTEWGHDAVCIAAGKRDYDKALYRLMKAGVYHRDMEGKDFLLTDEELEIKNEERRKYQEKLDLERQERIERAKIEDPDFTDNFDDLRIIDVEEYLKSPHRCCR